MGDCQSKNKHFKSIIEKEKHLKEYEIDYILKNTQLTRCQIDQLYSEFIVSLIYE